MIGNSILSRVNARRPLIGLMIGVLGLFAATACADLAGLDAAAAQAVVQNVDSLSGEVTVEFKDGTTTTFNLADVDVEALGQLIGSASLQAGDEVEVELDSSNSVRSLTSQAANVHAVILDVDTDAGTLTLEAANGVELSLNLTAQTRIELEDDEHGSVDGLVPGMPVKVKYDTDTDEALKIKHESEDEDGAEGEAKGVITAIDQDANSITVEDRNGVEETYTVHSDTEIEASGDSGFGDLEVGMEVKIQFDLDTLALREVHARESDDADNERDHGNSDDDSSDDSDDEDDDHDEEDDDEEDDDEDEDDEDEDDD